jgi:hypothetical protein
MRDARRSAALLSASSRRTRVLSWTTAASALSRSVRAEPTVTGSPPRRDPVEPSGSPSGRRGVGRLGRSDGPSGVRRVASRRDTDTFPSDRLGLSGRAALPRPTLPETVLPPLRSDPALPLVSPRVMVVGDVVLYGEVALPGRLLGVVKCAEAEEEEDDAEAAEGLRVRVGCALVLLRSRGDGLARCLSTERGASEAATSPEPAPAGPPSTANGGLSSGSLGSSSWWARVAAVPVAGVGKLAPSQRPPIPSSSSSSSSSSSRSSSTGGMAGSMRSEATRNDFGPEIELLVLSANSSSTAWVVWPDIGGKYPDPVFAVCRRRVESALRLRRRLCFGLDGCSPLFRRDWRCSRTRRVLEAVPLLLRRSNTVSAGVGLSSASVSTDPARCSRCKASVELSPHPGRHGEVSAGLATRADAGRRGCWRGIRTTPAASRSDKGTSTSDPESERWSTNIRGASRGRRGWRADDGLDGGTGRLGASLALVCLPRSPLMRSLLWLRGDTIVCGAAYACAISEGGLWGLLSARKPETKPHSCEC